MKIYNTLTRRKENFKTIKNNEVSIYVCGITPYDTTHLGHAFTYVSFDALIRYLKYKGYKVNYTQNVTDIDDDILKKAREENKDWKILGQFWTDKFLKDLKFLNVLMPANYVKATESMEKIVDMVKSLVAKDFAYIKEGNVYFDIKKFKAYGQLSKYTEKQMVLISKERGADPKDPLKVNPLDFILWQKTKKGEPFWESPFGLGRPGWHIECSAMINRYLGESIDIHGGGRDLIFPHHESEIAQSESFTDKSPFVNYWMHTSMVIYEGEKMSKSLGNLIMISDLAKKYDANTVRWLLLSHHYREPWEFDYSEIDHAKTFTLQIDMALSKKLKDGVSKNNIKEFKNFMDDDLNIPQALIMINNISKNILSGKEVFAKSQQDLRKMLDILGFVF